MYGKLTESGALVLAENSVVLTLDGVEMRVVNPTAAQYLAAGYLPVRLADKPWRCAQVHDSAGNDAWTPGAAASLWSPYHSKSPDWALPWVKPTGAHDAYQKGEYMVWSDGGLYRCKQDNTVWSPVELPEAWEVVT